MMDIKKFAAGAIAGAAIAVAPVMAFAAPASAATDASNPAATAASHSQSFSSGQNQLGSSGQNQLGSGSGFAHTSHCGGGIYCGC